MPRHIRPFGALLLLICFSHPVWSQMNRLSFVPIAAEYSTALDRIVMVGAGPNRVYLSDPPTGTMTTVALNAEPVSLSVRLDGRYAAVGHSGSISYVNLVSGTVEKTLTITGTPRSMVLATDYIYFPNRGYISIATGTGQYSSLEGAALGARLLPNGRSYYVPENYAFYRNDLSGANVTQAYINQNLCPPLAVTPDSLKMLGGCGAVVALGTTTPLVLENLGSLPGVQSSAANFYSDALKRFLVIPSDSGRGSNQISLFNDVTLAVRGTLQIPDVSHSPRSRSYGRWVFANNAGTAVHAIVQADPATAPSINAVYSVRLSNPSDCLTSFAGSPGVIDGAGSNAFLEVLSDGDCAWQAMSDVSWIQILSGLNSGAGYVTFHVRANPFSASRTGTIRVGSASLAITQGPAPALSRLSRLPYAVADAGFSKSLNLLIVAATDPNELHIYNPVNRDDRYVSLSEAPAKLSVSPDGLFAAVTHGRSVSYVDLRTASVIRVFQLPIGVSTIALAGNGYFYAFAVPPQSHTRVSVYSVEIATGMVSTAASELLSSLSVTSARVHPASTELYAGSGSYLFRLDIRQGVATFSNTPDSRGCSQGGSLWLSDDGDRLFDSCSNVFRTVAGLPLNGSLGLANVVSLSNSSIRGMTVGFLQNWHSDTDLQLFAAKDNESIVLNYVPLGKLSYLNRLFSTRGRFAFWDGQSANVYAVSRVDATAGLISDWVVERLDAPAPCQLAVQPSAITVPARASSGVINVSVASGCRWEVSTSESSYIYFPVGSGPLTGPAILTYQIEANTTTGQRTGSIRVGGKTVTVTQLAPDPQGPAPTLTFSPTFVNLRTGEATSVSFNVFSPISAYVSNVSTMDSWIRNLPTSITGSSTIFFSVTANLGPARTGTIRVNNQEFTVFQAGSQSPPSRFIPVTPCRLIDTRPDSGRTGDVGAPPLAAGSRRDFPVAGLCGIPTGAVAMSVNVTVVPLEPLGFLSVWAGNQVQPPVSTLNSPDGRIKANAAITQISTAGLISIFSTNRTHVVVDVNGYFTPVPTNPPSDGLQFYPVTPCRVSDTRQGSTPVTPALVRTFIIASTCGVPEGARAFALNLTAVPRGPLGYLTAFPAFSAQPFVSNLNSPTGSVVANAAIVTASPNGAISIYASNPTDVVIDVTGYFAPPNAAGLNYYAIPPCRVSDSRSPNGSLGGPVLRINETREIPVSASGCNVPSGAIAYSLNATVVPVEPLAYLTLWPTGQTQPLVSTLNAGDGTASNAAIVSAGYTGRINAFVPGATHLIVDLNGYFAP